MNKNVKELLERERLLSEALAESLGEGNYIDGNYVYDEEELIRPVTPREKALLLSIQEIRDKINEVK